MRLMIIGIVLVWSCAASDKEPQSAPPPPTRDTIVERAFDAVRPQVLRCMQPGQRVAVGVNYPGSGEPLNIRVLEADPPLDAMATACLITQVKKLRHEPFKEPLSKVHRLP